MKKVIFISALAIAAAVSCTKSDIVDTKFNEAISFENYVGRDAQTKAATYGSTNKPTEIGIYGFYTGSAKWTTGSKSNLWGNLKVNGSTGAYSSTYAKYWTNDNDYYTFLAYAPFVGPETEDGGQNTTTYTATYGDGSLEVPAGLVVENPSIKYIVPSTLADQKDVLYSYAARTAIEVENGENANAHIDVKKGDVDAESKAITLNLKHALSRITVKASEASTDFSYTIKSVEISGSFVKEASLTLATGIWTPAEAVAETYTIHASTATAVPVPDTSKGESVYDFAAENSNNNYLMIIPQTVAEARIAVTYTTTYGGNTSTDMTKYVDLKDLSFEDGMAYSLNLVFAPNTTDKILFTVTVENWPTDEEPVLVESGEGQNNNPVVWDEL